MRLRSSRSIGERAARKTEPPTGFLLIRTGSYVSRRDSDQVQEKTMTTVLKAKLLAGIFLVAIAITAPAQTVSTIYQFSNGTNPNLPAGVMAQGQDGNFYGITLSGGSNANVGAIYKISSKGVLT